MPDEYRTTESTYRKQMRTAGNGVAVPKRMSFQITNETAGKIERQYHFILNPEDYSQTEQNRVTITPTKGGAYVDRFGPGLINIQLSGTTGYARREGDATINGVVVADSIDGWIAFNKMREDIYRYFLNASKDSRQNYQLYFYNWRERETERWRVEPQQFTLRQSASKPLLYMYNIEMTVVGSADDADKIKDAYQAMLVSLDLRMPKVATAISATVEAVLEQFSNELSAEQADAAATLAQSGMPSISSQPPATINALKNVLDKAGDLTTQLQDYVDGKTNFISTPMSSVTAMATQIRGVLEDFTGNYDLLNDNELGLIRNMRTLYCNVSVIASYPDLFKQGINSQISDIRNLFMDSGCATTLRA
ncbi:MAG: hypothetical protein PHS46_08160 [Candidatus Omnitrophica bacterium]|nr:hypothetical protein [Candidatus Omnitrophota bacterium]